MTTPSFPHKVMGRHVAVLRQRRNAAVTMREAERERDAEIAKKIMGRHVAVLRQRREAMREASPALDAEVAEKVMRLHRDDVSYGDGLAKRCEWYDSHGRLIFDMPEGQAPYFSSDIATAWKALDEMIWRVGTANIAFDMEDYGRGAVTRDTGAERAVWVTIGEHSAVGPAPLAICLAALAAVEA